MTAARQDTVIPPNVDRKAMAALRVLPLISHMVAASTMAEVIKAAAIGLMPRSSMGKKKNTKQINVNTSAAADFIPFLPPMRQRSRRKAPIKA